MQRVGGRGETARERGRFTYFRELAYTVMGAGKSGIGRADLELVGAGNLAKS